MSEVPLDSPSVILGRSPTCDVVLPSSKVSRRHARVFRDAGDRWVIEDMQSRNGVWVNGERVSAHALLPGELVRVGTFELSLAKILARPAQDDLPTGGTTTTLWEPPAQQVTVGPDEPAGVLSQDHLAELNRIFDRLGSVTEIGDLYTQACRQLAAVRGTAAIVVRVPVSLAPLPDRVETLASHFGGPDKSPSGGTPLHLSRRVLEAARNTSNPVMATDRAAGRSDSDDPASLRLTVSDAASPRAVFCVPVTEPGDHVDLLYLDVPVEAAGLDMLEFVRAVARQLGFILKNLLFLKAQAERVRLEAQLRLAKEIQSRLVPQAMTCPNGLEVAICYEPAAWVGGDYCDVWYLPHGRLAVAVGDVSGKGLPAAIIMANLQASLRSTSAFCSDPVEIMQHVNRLLIQNLPDRAFVTLFLGLLDCESGRLDFINAGHLLPLVVRPGQDVCALGQPVNTPLGTRDRVFVAQSETLEPGAALLAFTDGVTEAVSPGGTRFGTAALQEILAAREFNRGEDLIKTIRNEVCDFRQGVPQQDDLTLVAVVNTVPVSGTRHADSGDALRPALPLPERDVPLISGSVCRDVI